MRTLISTLVILAAPGMLLLAGCDEEKILPQSLAVDFSFSKLDGTPSDTFRTGEQFTVRLSITNLTGGPRSWSFTMPDAIFRISSNDSVLITSADGYAFPMVILGRSIKPGETVTYQWLAPTSGLYPAGITIAPGRYVASGQAHLLLDRFSPVSSVSRYVTIVSQ